MFELNLIKDKAKARQRRRVIFLSVVSIVFLAGLLGIFVGSLFWRETIRLKSVNEDIARKQGEIDKLNAELEIREPAARKRRNGLIEAWEEDASVRQDRPFFNPILSDMAEHHPASAEFWYNDITISTSGSRGPANTEDPYAPAKDLMGSRGLEASGYIEIEASDIVTESELNQVAKQMDGMLRLVGEPKFNLEISGEAPQSGDTEASRYVPFNMRAAQTTFRPDQQAP
ncbi:MAG: hypothetical protein K8I27_05440 [Planctomycetes bacterium]|nr:hypothetical protein [Planctomycetota bacterium]